jgi:hypothetical protein
MKRHGFLFDRIVAFDNLTEAARKAFRGQKDRPAVARMYFHLETELWQLQEELVSGAYLPRPYHVFEIREPKRREICAADIRDRVAHHAICNLLGPIFVGNLTSQYFANLYLGELDHFVKERLRVAGYLRYMDDFILFGPDKPSLREKLLSVREFVTERLRLELKEEATIIAPVSQGASFLGFRVFPQLVKLSGEKWRRFRHRVRKLEEDFSAGLISEDELARSVGSMLGHIRHADTLAARQKFFDLCN